MRVSCNPGRLRPIRPDGKREVPPNDVYINSAGGNHADSLLGLFSALALHGKLLVNSRNYLDSAPWRASYVASVGKLLGRPASMHILELFKMTFLTFLPVLARHFD
jgi:hypothetical protein